MAAINRVVLVGNLTRDPELRHTPSAAAAAATPTTACGRHATAASIGNRRSSRRTSGRSTAVAAPPRTAGTARRIARENDIGPTLRSADPTAARHRQ